MIRLHRAGGAQELAFQVPTPKDYGLWKSNRPMNSRTIVKGPPDLVVQALLLLAQEPCARLGINDLLGQPGLENELAIAAKAGP